MKFYTLKSQITNLYLINGDYKSKNPVFFNSGQVNYWIERFTNRLDSHKLDEMVLESYTLSDPYVEDKRLEQRKTRIHQVAVVAKLKDYQD